MKKTTALLAVVTVLLAASPASAAIRIKKIYFDSPGSDYRSNSSLNAEYVVLRNTGSRAKRLTDWTVRDSAGHVYRFGSFTLGAGKNVTIHTGRGANTSAHRYWGSGNYVWNNDGDRATLKNSSGSKVDSCSYSGSGDYTFC